ncbi:MAG: ABC transporter ATP-binding protein [Chloroflexi bacterium]|nr:ABC transporter ATP-binding protein [Chloroflexota bacterium]
MSNMSRASDAPAIILTKQLTKQYGTSTAVSDLNLRVRDGEIYGFLGPNGAGKTTTMLMLLGIEQPTHGQFTLFGMPGPGDPFTIKRRIGVVAEHQHLPDDQTAWEYLLFFGRLYGVERPAARAAALLERLHLSEFRNLLARDYSRGMQQKLGLARALLHAPELLILDEPVSGLDPHGIRQVRELLQEEHQRGVTILVSSHILSEVERTADRVGILHGGRLVAEDSVAAISARLDAGATLTLELDAAPAGLVAALRAQPYVGAVDVANESADDTPVALRVRLADSGDHRRDLSALIAAHGGLITGMHQERLSLEEAFVRLTADNVAAAAGRRLTGAPASGPTTRATPRRVTKRRAAR